VKDPRAATSSLHDLGGGGTYAGVVVRRADNGDGTFTIHLSGSSRILFGHGGSRGDAARHLAKQLRDVAALVEAQEGVAP
jgi:hypothetical protein